MIQPLRGWVNLKLNTFFPPSLLPYLYLYFLPDFRTFGLPDFTPNFLSLCPPGCTRGHYYSTPSGLGESQTKYFLFSFLTSLLCICIFFRTFGLSDFSPDFLSLCPPGCTRGHYYSTPSGLGESQTKYFLSSFLTSLLPYFPTMYLYFLPD